MPPSLTRAGLPVPPEPGHRCGDRPCRAPVLSPGRTVVGGTPFATHLGRTWYELGLGVTAGFGKSGALYANVKYARNIGGDYRRGIVGQVGYRYSW